MTHNGKVAIVTGAAGGIGLGIAKKLSEQGCLVALCDINAMGVRHQADLINESAGSAIAIECDVSNVESLQNMVGLTLNKFGRLDILVNNAGILDSSPILEMTDETWGGQHSATRMIAYAGERLNNERYIRAALGQLEMRSRMGGDAKLLEEDGRPVTISVPALEATNIDFEMPYFNTNSISQWSLNFMETMSILKDYLAKE